MEFSLDLAALYLTSENIKIILGNYMRYRTGMCRTRSVTYLATPSLNLGTQEKAPRRSTCQLGTPFNSYLTIQQEIHLI